MLRLALSFLLLCSLSACGRASTDLYLAYQTPSFADAEGNPLPDMGSQNRRSLQAGNNSGYYYTVPSQEDENTDNSENSETENTTQSAEETAPPALDTDAALPEDALARAEAKFNDLLETFESLIEKKS